MKQDEFSSEMSVVESNTPTIVRRRGRPPGWAEALDKAYRQRATAVLSGASAAELAALEQEQGERLAELWATFALQGAGR